MGLLTKNDSELYRHWFKEAARLRGLKITYRYVLSQQVSPHGEFINQVLSDSIELDAIYSENPKVKTLKALGWFSEDKSDKPYIIMLPFDTPHISNESRVFVPTYMELNDVREFRITDIKSLIEYPDCWICKLAPVMKSEATLEDFKDTNFNYIKED
jgi:hypothetical protein